MLHLCFMLMNRIYRNLVPATLKRPHAVWEPNDFFNLFLRSWETLRNEMTPQIFSHGNFLAFAKFSSRQSFLVKFPSWHLFLPRKKQLEKWKKWKQELKIKTSILPGFFVWILPWHICLFCAVPLLKREFDLEKVPKLNVIFLSWFIFATQPLPLLFINVPPSVSNSNYI